MKRLFYQTLLLFLLLLLKDFRGSSTEQEAGIIDIIVFINSSSVNIKNCVRSIIKHRSNQQELIQRTLFLVSPDGNSETMQFLEKTLSKYPQEFFISRELKTTSTITMLKVGKEVLQTKTKTPSSASVLLKSNSVVTHNWLPSLFNFLYRSDNEIGMVGPVSNSAGDQSIPFVLPTTTTTIALNPNNPVMNTLPPGLNVENLAWDVRKFAVKNKISHVPVLSLHPVCIMIRNTTVLSNSLLVESSDVPGNLELSLEAIKSGLSAAVIPSVYIYSSPSQDDIFPQSARNRNSSLGGTLSLKRRKGSSWNPDQPKELSLLRKQTQHLYMAARKRASEIGSGGSILFVLHDMAVAGGIVSVLQEALQMYRYGVRVAFSFPQGSAGGDPFPVLRAILPEAEEKTLRKLSVIHNGTHVYPTVDPSFAPMASGFDVLVATYCFTMENVRTAIAHCRKRHKAVLPAYYVQDYEPWFWSSPFQQLKKSDETFHKYAFQSYHAFEDQTVLFAKTRWTAKMVRTTHNRSVHLVTPSLDHSVYYPDQTQLSMKLSKRWGSSRFSVSAMIRPSTPRRNAIGALEVLLRLAHEHPHVQVNLFGSIRRSIRHCILLLAKEKGIAPHRDSLILKQPNVKVLGSISDREQLADLYRSSDVFVDLSWWQAFGRSALEAMASGCAAIMPGTGASTELCSNRERGKGKRRCSKERCSTVEKEAVDMDDQYFCLYHDGNDHDGYYKKMVSLLKNDTKRTATILRGLDLTRGFTVEAAAVSIAQHLLRSFKRFFE